MNSVLAKMAVQIAANTAQFDKAMANTSRSISGLSNEFKKINSVVSGFGKTLGALGIGVSIGALAKSIFDVGVKAEQTAIAFNTFLGSATRGKALLQELNQFSVETPFSPDQVNGAAKALLSFGLEANKILPTLKFLGDVSSGTGKDLKELAIIFGQIKSTGRLMGQDLLQLINAGFNPLQVISENTGKSMATLKKEMEKGLISFKMVEDAFKSATSEGGLFFNLMEKQSQTVGGLVSTLAGNFEELGKNLFSLASGPIPSAINAFNRLLGSINQFLTRGDVYQIAEIGLKRFRDKFKEIEGLIQSGNEKMLAHGRKLQNIFAKDVVDAINEASSELEIQEGFLEGLKATGIESGKTFEQTTAKVAVLKAELSLLRDIRDDLFKLKPKKADDFVKPIKSNLHLQIIPSGHELDTVPDVANMAAVNANKEFSASLIEIGTSAEFAGGAMVKLQESTMSAMQNIKKESIDATSFIAGGITEIADALGSAFINGPQEFGRGFLRALGGFAQQFGSLLISIGIAEKALKFGTPAHKIAAGIALVALGGAIRALSNRTPSMNGGGGEGSQFYRSSVAGSNFGDLTLNGTLRLKGNMEAVLENARIENTYRRA